LEQMSTAALPGPVRYLMTQLHELWPGGAPDMIEVGRLLMGLAADEEYFAPLIAQMPAGSPGLHWLARPERGRPPTIRWPPIPLPAAGPWS
jgi:hypothetical protein